MLRVFAVLFALLPGVTVAQCAGDNFLTMLSDAQRAELDQRAAETPYGAGNFWQARKDGTTLSILGTMHLPDPRHNAILLGANSRLANADLLLVEATLEDQAAMQAYMARNPEIITINDGTTLADHLSPEAWTSLRAAATERGLPGFMAAKMQPWFLAMTLAIPPCAMTSMISGAVGLDGMLMEQAAALDIPVAALEPWEDTFALIRSGTFEEQIANLELSIIDPALHDATMVALTDLYFDGQSAKAWYMNSYIRSFMPDVDQAELDAQFAELEKMLLIDRNRSWIAVIEDAAGQHDSIFIGFGAAHLFGEVGVLQLLENNGWTIAPL